MGSGASVRLVAAAFAVAMVSGIPGESFATELNGWLREAGHGSVALSYTSEGYDEFWVGKTKVSDPGVGEVHTRTLSLWFAYGLSDRLTITGNLPFVNTDSNGLGNFSDRSFQDASLLGEYALLRAGSRFHHTLIGAVGFRTPVVNYEANLPVDVGDGTSDWLLRAVYQFNIGGFYASQQVGYDLRGADAPNDWTLYTEVGQTVGPVTFTGFYSRLLTNDGTDIGDPGFTFPSNRENWTRVGAKVYGRVTDRFGLAGTYFTTLDGRNTGDISGGSVSAVFGY